VNQGGYAGDKFQKLTAGAYRQLQSPQLACAHPICCVPLHTIWVLQRRKMIPWAPSMPSQLSLVHASRLATWELIIHRCLYVIRSMLLWKRRV